MSIYVPITIDNSTIINPFEFWNNAYVLYYHFSRFTVIADTLQDALEEFGCYCEEQGIDGYIKDDISGMSQEEIDDFYFPVNGGEFYVELPAHAEKIEVPKFKYFLTYEIITPESAENGDAEERGLEEEDYATMEELLTLAQDYNITSNDGADWLYSVDPIQNREFFEKSKEVYYSLHIIDHEYKDKINDAIITMLEF